MKLSLLKVNSVVIRSEICVCTSPCPTVDIKSASIHFQIVNLEEARRRISMAEDELIPIPDFSDPSTIIAEENIKKVT